MNSREFFKRGGGGALTRKTNTRESKININEKRTVTNTKLKLHKQTTTHKKNDKTIQAMKNIYI